MVIVRRLSVCGLRLEIWWQRMSGWSGERAPRGSGSRARASPEPEFTELVAAAVAGSAMGAAASGREGVPVESGAGSMVMRASIGGCFRPSGLTSSSSIGPSGAGRARASSARRSASMR